MQNPSNENEEYYFFYPKPDNAGKSKKQIKSRSVIAAIYNKESNTLSFGIAICSKKDVFIKKVGRVKALGRAKYHIPILCKLINKEEPLITQFIDNAKVIERVANSKFVGENKLTNKTKDKKEYAL